MCLENVSVEGQRDIGNLLGLLRFALWPPTTFPGLADMVMFDGVGKIVVMVGRVVRVVRIVNSWI